MITPQEKPLHWAEAFGLSALVHVGIAYFVLTTVVDLDRVFDFAPEAAPSLQITSLSVDTSTLTSTDIGSGSDPQSAPRTLAPVADVVEPVSPVAAQSEPASVASAATTPLPQTLAPVQTAAAAIAPEAISPLRPESPTLAPVTPTASDARRQSVQTPGTPTASVAATPEPEEVAPRAPTPPAAVTPASDTAAPEPAEAPTPSSAVAPDPLAADLINRIRGAVGEECLIAIPRQGVDGTLGVQIFTATESAVAPFADTILDGMTPRPDLTTTLIDPRQCAALDFIRQSVTYPTSPMALGLDTARIASDEELTGRIGGTGGRNVTLILVDDNGVVQDLGQYLSVAVNTARFAAPLRRVGAVRDARPLLIALGTGSRPAAATAQNGQLAETYFSSLRAEVDGNATLALVPFDVR